MLFSSFINPAIAKQRKTEKLQQSIFFFYIYTSAMDVKSLVVISQYSKSKKTQQCYDALLKYYL